LPATAVLILKFRFQKDCQVEFAETGFKNEIAFDNPSASSGDIQEFQNELLPPH